MSKQANDIAALFRKASVRTMAQGSNSALLESIPTGVDVLDNWVLGCGGLPVGRLVELYSDAGVGKTSISFMCLAAAQRAGGIGVLYETERSLIPERADIFGVDRNKIILAEPDTMNDVIDQLVEMLGMIPDGVGPNVIVWDSLAASPTANEVKGKPQPGDQARQMSSSLRLMARLLAPKRTSLVIVNQTRQSIGVVFGDNTVTPGGNALKFYASIRLALWKGSTIKEGDDAVGHRITIKAMKNKVAFPFRKASLRLDYRYGFDDEWSTIDFAKERGVVPKGSRMTPEVYGRALEGLKNLPGYYPNGYDPTAKEVIDERLPGHDTTNRNQHGEPPHSTAPVDADVPFEVPTEAAKPTGTEGTPTGTSGVSGEGSDSKRKANDLSGGRDGCDQAQEAPDQEAKENSTTKKKRGRPKKAASKVSKKDEKG